ncbi:hypothetical protein P692DRAFT_20833193, partial [Suillus brevipes Sb2]
VRSFRWWIRQQSGRRMSHSWEFCSVVSARIKAAPFFLGCLSRYLTGLLPTRAL